MPTAVSRASASQSLQRSCSSSIASQLQVDVNVATVNINIPLHVDIVNITPYDAVMARKRADRYHHGDLSRSLLKEALRTIEKDGVAALTMRGRGREARAYRGRRFIVILPTSRRCWRPSQRKDSGRCALQTQEAWDRHGGGRKGSRRWGRHTCDLPSSIPRITASCSGGT